MNFDTFIDNLPEVTSPKRKLSFDEKLKWTGLALLSYFILSLIPLYGLDPGYKAQFETLSVLLAAKFGSLITLGIGPIVTASIILQLLTGAEVIKINVNTKEGKRKYQGMQKLFSIAFIIIENSLYVISGALPSATGSFFNISILALQLVLGGFIIMLLDELVSKWGIGSGISLFIAAGVSQQIFTNAFSFIQGPTGYPIGSIPTIIVLISQGMIKETLWPIMRILSTIAVFALSIFVQSIKINIPLSYGRVRGYNISWPLKFIYTSNIPVILVAAFMASMQFWGLSLYKMGVPILGTFEKSNGVDIPKTGLVKYIRQPQLSRIITYGLIGEQGLNLLVYLSFMLFGSVLFSVLWVSIGGQDAGTVAEQIISSNLGIPGFRRDKRILERVLNRYIKPLSVMGGFVVGLLAVTADLFDALSRGTGILLTVMILYDFYERAKPEIGTSNISLISKLSKK